MYIIIGSNPMSESYISEVEDEKPALYQGGKVTDADEDDE